MKACTISGSFNHFYDEVSMFHSEILHNNSYKILSPLDMNIRNQSTDFILLKSDVSNKINQIEDSHLNSISKSNFLLVVNPNDYIGVSTALEIGYAKALHIPIKFVEKSKHDFGNKIKLDAIKFKDNTFIIQSDKTKNRDYLNNIIEDLENTNKCKLILSKKTKINKLNESELMLIDSPNGKVSNDNAFRIGYAYASNVPIIFTEEPSDILLKEMILSRIYKKNKFNLRYEFDIIIKPTIYIKDLIDSFLNKNKPVLKLI